MELEIAEYKVEQDNSLIVYTILEIFAKTCHVVTFKRKGTAKSYSVDRDYSRPLIEQRIQKCEKIN